MRNPTLWRFIRTRFYLSTLPCGVRCVNWAHLFGQGTSPHARHVHLAGLAGFWDTQHGAGKGCVSESLAHLTQSIPEGVSCTFQGFMLHIEESLRLSNNIERLCPLHEPQLTQQPRDRVPQAVEMNWNPAVKSGLGEEGRNMGTGPLNAAP